jgi:hypothetical protein
MSTSLRKAIREYCDEKEDWNKMCAEWSCMTRTRGIAEKCICGVHIVENCIIIHNRTFQTLVIGNECIAQFERLLPLCNKCEIYPVATIGSRQCKKCRSQMTRPSLQVRYGHFKYKTYADAFAENKAICKWELQHNVHAHDPHFTEYLAVRMKANIGGFQIIDPIEPPPPPPPRPILPPPRPDYAKLYKNTIINFGKHKRKTYSQIVKDDPDYCLWILRNEEFKYEPIHLYLTARLKK